LLVEAVVELLEVCLGANFFFQADDKFFQQKYGMTMRINIYMEHFEKLTLDSTQYK
jgi:hypothetical protein